MWTHEEEETQSGYKCAYYLPYIGRKWWKNGESSSKGDDFMTQSLSHPSALTISSFGPHSAVNINLLTHTCCHWIKFHSVICQECFWSRVSHSSEEKLKLHNTQRISSANWSFNVLPQITASPISSTHITFCVCKPIILISFVFIYVFQLHAKVVVQVVKGYSFFDNGLYCGGGAFN